MLNTGRVKIKYVRMIYFVVVKQFELIFAWMGRVFQDFTTVSMNKNSVIKK